MRPDQSVRARAVIADGERLLLDRTAHRDRPPFHWFPGGGMEPGETSAETLARELWEEASLRIEVGPLLYVSENLFVESGEYRHETILYRRARIVAREAVAPADPRELRWARIDELDGPLLPPDVAAAVAHDLVNGFDHPPLHLVNDARVR